MERYATRQGEILERARKRQLRKEAQSRASKQAHQDKIHRDNTRSVSGASRTSRR